MPIKTVTKANNTETLEKRTIRDSRPRFKIFGKTNTKLYFLKCSVPKNYPLKKEQSKSIGNISDDSRMSLNSIFSAKLYIRKKQTQNPRLPEISQ